MSIQVRSGATTDILTVDITSKAARVTRYDSSGREISDQSKATYAASGTFTPAATPNDLLTIFGSATKTVRVISLKFGANNTAAGSQQYNISKRSAVTTGGTPVAATAVPLDANNLAATATVNHYTADPTPGTALGNINILRVASPVLVPATFAGIVQNVLHEMLPTDGSGLVQPVTLRGVTQGLAVNFGDVALVAGQIHVYTVLWTEE